MSKEVNKLLAETYGLTKHDFWQLPRGSWIVSYNGIKQIIDKENIQFQSPDFIIKTLSDDIYIHCQVTGEMGDKVITEVGSACNRSLTSPISKAYPSEMAYKRAISRCVIRLLGLTNVYGVEESDSFQKANVNINNVKIEREVK